MDALLTAQVGFELDRLRNQTDDYADHLIAQRWGEEPATKVLRDLGANTIPSAGDKPDAIEQFLSAGDEKEELEQLIDVNLVNHAQRFFETYGLQISAGLLFGSLPDAYSAARGVQVLYLTSELVSDPRRRIRETLFFLIEMLARPDSGESSPTTLHAGQRGARAARRLRLFHAAVRRIIREDMQPRWETRRELYEKLDGPALGEPVNAEDLLGTLFTFTVSIEESLQSLGVFMTEKDRRAWYHIWDIIGRHNGYRRDLGDTAGAKEEGRQEANPFPSGQTDRLPDLRPPSPRSTRPA